MTYYRNPHRNQHPQQQYPQQQYPQQQMGGMMPPMQGMGYPQQQQMGGMMPPMQGMGYPPQQMGGMMPPMQGMGYPRQPMTGNMPPMQGMTQPRPFTDRTSDMRFGQPPMDTRPQVMNVKETPMRQEEIQEPSLIFKDLDTSIRSYSFNKGKLEVKTALIDKDIEVKDIDGGYTLCDNISDVIDNEFEIVDKQLHDEHIVLYKEFFISNIFNDTENDIDKYYKETNFVKAMFDAYDETKLNKIMYLNRYMTDNVNALLGYITHGEVSIDNFCDDFEELINLDEDVLNFKKKYILDYVDFIRNGHLEISEFIRESSIDAPGSVLYEKIHVFYTDKTSYELNLNDDTIYRVHYKKETHIATANIKILRAIYNKCMENNSYFNNYLLTSDKRLYSLTVIENEMFIEEVCI